MVEHYSRKLIVLQVNKMQVISATYFLNQSLDLKRKTELNIWRTVKDELLLTITGSGEMRMLWMKSWFH